MIAASGFNISKFWDLRLLSLFHPFICLHHKARTAPQWHSFHPFRVCSGEGARRPPSFLCSSLIFRRVPPFRCPSQEQGPREVQLAQGRFRSARDRPGGAGFMLDIFADSWDHRGWKSQVGFGDTFPAVRLSDQLRLRAQLQSSVRWASDSFRG